MGQEVDFTLHAKFSGNQGASLLVDMSSSFTAPLASDRE